MTENEVSYLKKSVNTIVLVIATSIDQVSSCATETRTVTPHRNPDVRSFISPTKHPLLCLPRDYSQYDYLRNVMPDIYSLIQSAGPGEINDVFADIRALVDNDTKVTSASKPELAKYNKDQLITTKVGSASVIISHHNELEDGKFYDAISGKSFKFDHLKLVASDVQTHTVEDADSMYVVT